MYDNNCFGSLERSCSRCGSECPHWGYVAIIAAVISGIAAYAVNTAGLIINSAVLFLGALGIILVMGIILVALVNRFISCQHKLCCCAKQRATGFIICALAAIILGLLYWGINFANSVLIAFAAAFFTLSLLFFIGFYHCFLKCRCTACENTRDRR